MRFDLDLSIDLLARTPATLDALLGGLGARGRRAVAKVRSEEAGSHPG